MGEKMKKITLLILVICMIFIFAASGTFLHVKAVTVPEKVRIGLYYKSTSPVQFSISAEKGLEFGSSASGNFTPIAVLGKTGESFQVRKDTYLVSSGDGLKEYSPTASTMPSGTKTGPYHVKIGGSLSDMAVAVKKAEELKQKGIDAYPVYEDSWQVWAGFYTDASTAQSNIEKVIKPKAGSETLTLITPPAVNNGVLSSERVVVLYASGNVAFLFGSQKGSALGIRAASDNSSRIVKLNTRRYRGEIIVRRLKDSDMTVVNQLTLNQYLYSVVPAEIGGKSPSEALKAQAVAARTYAVKNIKKHNAYQFDLCSTTDCQAYYGVDYETAESINAVEATTGKVITYKGQLIEATYFASDGGRTEDSENVWLNKVDYLRSVEDPYESQDAPSLNWTAVFTAEQIKNLFGGSLGDILSVEVTKRSAAGRAIEVVVKGTLGSKTLQKESCRTAFGSAVKSQLYTIVTDTGTIAKSRDSQAMLATVEGKKVVTADGLKTINIAKENISVIGADGNVKKLPVGIPKTYTFIGKGSGHAVGMSQEGAIGMAKAGKSYIEILKHFYTGVEIE